MKVETQLTITLTEEQLCLVRACVTTHADHLRNSPVSEISAFARELDALKAHLETFPRESVECAPESKS